MTLTCTATWCTSFSIAIRSFKWFPTLQISAIRISKYYPNKRIGNFLIKTGNMIHSRRVRKKRIKKSCVLKLIKRSIISLNSPLRAWASKEGELANYLAKKMNSLNLEEALTFKSSLVSQSHVKLKDSPYRSLTLIQQTFIPLKCLKCSRTKKLIQKKRFGI